MRVAILDDHLGIAKTLAPWGDLPPDCDVVFFGDHIDEVELVDRLGGFEVVMGMRERTPFPRRVLEQLPTLRLLITSGGRNPSFDLAAATELGVVVSGTAGSELDAAEHTWGLILALARSIPQEDRRTRGGAWGTSTGVRLRGATLGLLGLGRLGAAVARVAVAFEMRVVAWSPNLTTERAAAHGATAVNLQQLYAMSDVVSIHLPLVEGTRGLVGEAALASMRSTALLVNTSRGPIVDEDALLAALDRGAIAGAALDVFSQEPLPHGHPLLAREDVILTPHIGYVTRRSFETFYSQTVEIIDAYCRGESTGVLNPEVLSASA